MSRVTVRSAIQSYLSGSVPGINTVYTAFRVAIPGSAFFPAGAGATGGAVLIVNITSVVENPITVGGDHDGWKRIDYGVDLQLFHRYIAPAAPGGDIGEDAQAAFDAVIDALEARVRADRQAGTGGSPIWQWGRTLQSAFDTPSRNEEGIVTWGAVRTTATEWIRA